MNDNIQADSNNHAYALALISDLMLILQNASNRGLECYDEAGEPVFDFQFWSNECAKALNVRQVA